MRNLTLLLALLFGAACQSREADCAGSFSLGSGFSTWEEENVYASAELWNEWVGYSAVSVKPEGTCKIEKSENVARGPAEYDRRTGEIRIRRSVRFSETADETRFRMIIMHELGHSLGLDHVPGPAVMSENVHGVYTTDFSLSDRLECISAGVCSD